MLFRTGMWGEKIITFKTEAKSGFCYNLVTFNHTQSRGQKTLM